MDVLLEQSAYLLSRVQTGFRRYLFDQIHWNSRLIGIKGARGTGKTTLALQWLKLQNLPSAQAAYFTLDDLYFTTNSLKETVARFHRQGGKMLVLDEVHKYRTWATEIKNIYDLYPDLKIIFTGSSIIDISRQQADLSRRAVMYELNGMSYREYLLLNHQLELPLFSLETLMVSPLQLRDRFPVNFRPLEFFNQYLRRGYYPFVVEDADTVHLRLRQLIRAIVEVDMAELREFDIRNARKMMQLLYVIAQQVPFKPNISALSEKTEIHRNSLNSYLHYLEQAKLIALLHPTGNSVSTLQKPEKIYLNNTNLLYALAEKQVERGNLRKTFFYSQLQVVGSITVPKQGDFMVDEQYIFEIGGRLKSGNQVKGLPNAKIVKDDIEYPVGHELPLWLFGFLY